MTNDTAPPPLPPPPPEPPPRPKKAAGLATAALVCSIVGLVPCLPQMAAAGTVLAIVALVKRTTARLRAWAGLTLGLAGLVLSGVFLAGELKGAHDLAYEIRSAQNVSRVGEALQRYRSQHEGRFPASLQQLADEGLLHPKVLNQASERPLPYIYASPQAALCPGEKVMIVCEGGNDPPRGRRVVLCWTGCTATSGPASRPQEWEVVTMAEQRFQEELPLPHNSSMAEAMQQAGYELPKTQPAGSIPTVP